MPPNLGGFFMVRSYYPSECHADYFDFERIEALKPAIEACGISTLSQSPMLGFHKQMDNRIKLLEEILSFRMQGVEFDNGDTYVDGHKAASDVRDEFVSVTEKLMDELAQCYNVLPQIDINNTIDLFFFSSRRRHTRFDCDWSSDVCSSDLIFVGVDDHGARGEMLHVAVNSRGGEQWLIHNAEGGSSGRGNGPLQE